ncbi:MAG: nucleotidyltransferase family protein [Thermoflexibacter sp.]
MIHQETIEIAENFKSEAEIIKAYFKDKPVKKAYLFGSYVRGEAREDSDIDILVELDYQVKIGLLFVKMKLELEDLLHKKVDLVSEKGFSKYIKPIVDNEKKLIYVR